MAMTRAESGGSLSSQVRDGFFFFFFFPLPLRLPLRRTGALAANIQKEIQSGTRREMVETGDNASLQLACARGNPACAHFPLSTP